MNFHHDPDLWLWQAQKEYCPYCQKGEDPIKSVTLKYFRSSELCAHPQVCLRGTCYLITYKHYVELFDLYDEALLWFMKEVQVASRVLKEVTGAFKINYEIQATRRLTCTSNSSHATWMILLPVFPLIIAASIRLSIKGTNLISLSEQCKASWKWSISSDPMQFR